MNSSYVIARFTFALRAIAVLAFGLIAPLSAQEIAGAEPAATPPPQTTAESSSELPPASDRGSLAVLPEFKIQSGETLEKVVDRLAETTHANFVVEESLKQMDVQPLKLRNVRVTSVLDAIRMTSKSRIVISYAEERPPTAMVVTIVPGSRDPQDSKPKKICRVFSLPDAGWVWGRFRAVPSPADDASKEEMAKWERQEEKAQRSLHERVTMVDEAVQQACKSLANANGEKRTSADFPKFEVHSASRLIMVIGHEADVEIAAQIISGVGGVAMHGAKTETRNSNQENRPTQQSRPTQNPALN